jgi:hypothetical protein
MTFCPCRRRRDSISCMRATASHVCDLGGPCIVCCEWSAHAEQGPPYLQVVLDDSKVDAFLAGCSEQFEAILDAVRLMFDAC